MPHEKYLGCGLYDFATAAHLLRVEPHVLMYWLGETRRGESIIVRQLREDRLLTFAELMELHFIKMFREQNVSIQAIRKAAKAASKKFESEYPFSVRRFDTDGRTIFATLRSKETDKEIIEDLQRGQLVFKKIVRPFFKKLDYRGTQDVERYWPLHKSGRVVLDPARHFGRPIDSQTGVPIDAIIQAVRADGGQDPQSVANWFKIPREAVMAAIRFERALAN